MMATRTPSGGAGGQTSAIRRIQLELKEISGSRSRHWTAAPAGDDLFEWQFVIRGPPATDFEGGIYTGRLVLPVNYPFAPPSITLLTPNGRFEVGKKICLSNSNYHPELWQPAWGIRTMMEALRSHFPVPGDGAIGAIDLPSDLRRRLAQESLDFVCPLSNNKKNRELLPELSPEEMLEEDPEPRPMPSATIDTAGTPGPTMVAEGGASPPAVTAAPSPAPPPAPATAAGAAGVQESMFEGMRQRRGDPAVSAEPAVAQQTPSEMTAGREPPVATRRRRRAGDDVPRAPRRQEPVLIQLLKPPRTKRGWLITVIDLLLLVLTLSFCWTFIDIVRSPPQLLDAMPVARDKSGA
eukprot:TRINITY_DN74604_c0_g1_i1.p1 TRINITY_DN74604_c0_g1~~TRINITY_DN74604_c0_g1_i1.p1  ORF type:complete len:352 (+),score=48.45 TRINITY_DN74604_c0_g1_i1:141-1196(+)